VATRHYVLMHNDEYIIDATDSPTVFTYVFKTKRFAIEFASAAGLPHSVVEISSSDLLRPLQYMVDTIQLTHVYLCEAMETGTLIEVDAYIASLCKGLDL